MVKSRRLCLFRLVVSIREGKPAEYIGEPLGKYRVGRVPIRNTDDNVKYNIKTSRK